MWGEGFPTRRPRSPLPGQPEPSPLPLESALPPEGHQPPHPQTLPLDSLEGWPGGGLVWGGPAHQSPWGPLTAGHSVPLSSPLLPRLPRLRLWAAGSADRCWGSPGWAVPTAGADRCWGGSQGGRSLQQGLTWAGGGPQVGAAYSLEDEGHGLLPVLPLERQGPREHLELQRQRRESEFRPADAAAETARMGGGRPRPECTRSPEGSLGHWGAPWSLGVTLLYRATHSLQLRFPGRRVTGGNALTPETGSARHR